MCVSAVYALSSQTIDGTVSTGYVDIRIQPLEIPEDKKVVFPGDEIDFTPKVENMHAEAYLRVKINYIDQNVNFLDYVEGFNNNFEKHGEYYYYKKIFNTNEVVQLFNKLKIPADAYSRVSDKKIKLEIIAEAIQGKNFVPDYTLSDPWKGNIPTKSVNDLYDITNYAKISISYEDNTESDIKVNSNFLGSLKSSMPGDSYVDSIELKNLNKKNAKYRLNISSNETNQNKINLLKKIKLTITKQSGGTVYNGSLIFNEKILLGTYDVNGEDRFIFRVVFSSELGNEFENLNPDLILRFSAEYDKPTPDPGPSPDEPDDSIAPYDRLPDAGEKTKPRRRSWWGYDDTIAPYDRLPQTFDKIGYSIILFITSSIGFIVVCFIYYKNNKKTKERKEED